MVHLGKEDLAALGAERAVTAAAADDELLPAVLKAPTRECCCTRAG
jgi:hypothetical protein